MPARSWRGRLSFAALSLFVLATLGAALVYPGGSWFHPHPGGGFSWVENFWCDLLREPAHGGAPNARSVTLMTLAFALLSVCLGTFWLAVSSLLTPGRARFVRGAGGVSSVLTAAVALVPSDRFPELHAIAVLAAGGLGFACGCLVAAWALQRPREVPVFWSFSLVLVVAAAINLALYVAVVYLDTPDTVLLPIVQKIATLALVGFIASGLSASASRPTP